MLTEIFFTVGVPRTGIKLVNFALFTPRFRTDDVCICMAVILILVLSSMPAVK